MMKSHLQDWIVKLDLREVRDPVTGRTNFRRASTASETGREELEKAVGESIKSVREARVLSKDQVAYLLGIDVAVYSAHKSAALSMPIGCVLHLCEVLGSSVEELCRPLLDYAEDRLETGERQRLVILRELTRFDAETLADVYAFLRHII